MQLIESYPTLQRAMTLVEEGIQRTAQSDRKVLGADLTRAVIGPGKRLRPLVMLLAAECAGRISPTTVSLATTVELLHTASLIHDDIVDCATFRRGLSSVNASRGSRVSVLLGDYLISRALDSLPVEECYRYLSPLAQVATDMCLGQLRELQSTGALLDESDYTEIARAKTGRLFGFCGRAGALSGGGEDDIAEALERFGEYFGLAYQYADDILDLMGAAGRSGKSEGRDLIEGKLTLPVILAICLGGEDARAMLLDIIEKQPIGEDDLWQVRRIVQDTGALETAWSRVYNLLGHAQQALEPLPNSEAKKTLSSLGGELFPMPIMSMEG